MGSTPLDIAVKRDPESMRYLTLNLKLFKIFYPLAGCLNLPMDMLDD